MSDQKMSDLAKKMTDQAKKNLVRYNRYFDVAVHSPRSAVKELAIELDFWLELLNITRLPNSFYVISDGERVDWFKVELVHLDVFGKDFWYVQDVPPSEDVIKHLKYLANFNVFI